MQGRREPQPGGVGDRRGCAGRDRRSRPLPGAIGRSLPGRVDVVVRAGRVVTASGVVKADVAVTGGRITEVGPRLDFEAGEEIDASGLHVFPGGVDAHVHFNEPGHTEWETIACGSAALAAGGYTPLVYMALNNLPLTTDTDALRRQLAPAPQWPL